MNKCKFATVLIIALLLSVVFVGLWCPLPTVKATDQTFGKTDIGGTSDMFYGDEIHVCRFSLSEAGSITKLTIYGGNHWNENSHHMTGCIYSDDGTGWPEDLEATTQEVNESASPAWTDMTFSSPVNLPAGTYHIGVNIDSRFDMYYDSGDTDQHHSRNYVYGSFPNDYGESGGHVAWNISIYATYTPSGADETPPTFGSITALNTLAGNSTQIKCTINEETALSSWKFAWNNTNEWTNSSVYLISGTSITARFNGTWKTTIDDKVQVQFWANDSSNNGAYSAITTFTLTSCATLNATQYTNCSFSQLRLVSISGINIYDDNPNWTAIASELASYGINGVICGGIDNYRTIYYSNIFHHAISDPPINYTDAIAIFHSYGIQVYCGGSLMLKSPYNISGIGDVRTWYLPQGGTIPNDVQIYEPSTEPEAYGYDSGWLDISNPNAWKLWKSLIDECFGNYSLDGYCFDYARWDDRWMPLSNSSRLDFEATTGLDIGADWSTWLADVIPATNGGNGKYSIQFLEWRNELVNRFIKNFTDEVRSFNPKAKFGATPHRIAIDISPAFWREANGQDFTAWIKQGSLDWVAPMIYFADDVAFSKSIPYIIGNATAEAHGRAAVIPLISTFDPYVMEPTVVASHVITSLNCGADGYLIGEYNGAGVNNPAVNESDGIPYTAPYLAALGLPAPMFALGNITVTGGGNTVISWDTSSATNSSIEYSTTKPVYNYTLTPDPGAYPYTFNFWLCKVQGTIVDNATNDVHHSFNISGTVHSFHITSGDSSGVATYTLIPNYTLTVLSSGSGTVFPTIGLHNLFEETNQTLIAIASSGYSFVNWTITFANGTVLLRTQASTSILIDQDITAKAYFFLDTYWVAVTITSPTNTTYSSGSITVTFSASTNGTLDKRWWRLYNSSTLVFGNTTYTGSVTYSGFQNGEHYRVECFANNTQGVENYTVTYFSVSITTINRWQMTPVVRDMDNNVVTSTMMLKWYNGSTLFSYTPGAYTLLDGTYSIETYYLGYLLNTTYLDTATYGNTTITLTMQIKPSASHTIIFDNPPSTLTITIDNSSMVEFTATGAGTFTIIIPSSVNATYISKNGVNQTYGSIWTFDSSNHLIIITSTLSTWIIDFYVSPSGLSVPILIYSIFGNIWSSVLLISLMPIIVLAAALIMLFYKRTESSTKEALAAILLFTTVSILIIVTVYIIAMMQRVFI